MLTNKNKSEWLTHLFNYKVADVLTYLLIQYGY